MELLQKIIKALRPKTLNEIVETKHFQGFVWIAFVAWLVVTALIFIFIADPNQAEKSLIRVLLMQIGTLVLFIGIAFVAFVATHKIPSKKKA